jgi:hypothetical protein
MLRALFAAALSVTASPALADAVVYSGTLGKAPIVLELTGDPKTETLPPAGRYFYASKGVDIPLTGLITVGGKLRMIELGVCTEATCTVDGNGKVTKAPPGGEWTLSFAADGQTLAGTWTGADKKKSFPIALTKIGIRELPTDSAVSPTALYAIVTELAMGDMPITEQTSPYDFKRMDVPQDKSKVETMEGSSFQYLSDPRTKFPFPTIVSLADGSDPSAANAYLEAQHWSFNADAFDCEARQYADFEWSPSVGYALGTYGGYTDNEFTEVLGLTPKILSYLESGSTDCGYAHPNNHAEYNNIDIAAGKPLAVDKIFLGWREPDDANGPGPSAALADFVRSHLKDADVDLTDTDCDYSNLIDTNLAVAFKPDNTVLLTLDGLEYAIQACGADLWEGPITDLKPYLALTAADYFPVLRN